MKFGLSEETISKIVTVLSKYSQIQKAILYGSRAKGNFKPGSDIDLTLFGNGIDLSLFNSIANHIDDLLLPQTVDLSVYDDIKNESLLEHIGRVGVVFYEQ